MSHLLMKLLGRVYRDEETGGGDGASAPAAEPASGGEAVDWEGMNADAAPGADDDLGDEGLDTPPAGESNDPEGAHVPPKEEATIAKDEIDPALETPKEETPPETPPEVQDESKVQTPEEQAAQAKALQEKFSEWRQAEIANLTKAYAFDEETAQRLQTEPELVLPQLAAELEMRATERALAAVQRLIPQMLPQVIHGTTAEKAATDFFYAKNPDLKKYHTQVLQAGVMFRKLNPKATADQAAEKVGNMVRTALGLEPLAPGKSSAKPAAKMTPHRPAAAGSSGSRPAPKAKDDNIWADLIGNDD